MIALLGGIRATIFASVAVIALAVAGVQTVRLDRAQYKLAKIHSDLIEAHASYQHKLREVEAEMLESLRRAELKSLQEQKNAKAEYNRSLAAVRAGKLHERFSCPRPSDDPRAPSGDSGEERRGLLEEDAAFLISEAHRADLIAIERNELIDIVVELRKILNER